MSLPFRLLSRNLKALCAGRNGHFPKLCPRYYWRRRGDMFSELSSAMQTMENRMKDIDREMNRICDEVQRVSPIRLPRLSLPFELLRTKEIPIVAKNGNSRSYKVELDMQGMEPEDIKISLKDNELKVSARREEKGSDGSSFISENTYRYTLPKEVNPDTIRSTLSEGVLTIEASLPALESKEIPVSIEDSNSDKKDSKTE